MFDELKKPVKDKDRLKSKAYATIMTNFGGLNLELHGDRAPKTVYNFIMLAKQGYYDDTIFHRLIPGFMVRETDQSVLTLRSKVVILLERDGEVNPSGVSRSETNWQKRAHTRMMHVVSWCVESGVYQNDADNSQWRTVDRHPTRPSSSLRFGKQPT